MEKINIAELLKDCPQGMELDCTSYDNVSFDKISDDKKATYPIFCYITDEKGNRSGISFTENGCESKRYGAKCVIFPKGKNTWEGFHRPFKDGDIVATNANEQIFILQRANRNTLSNCYQGDCYIGYDFEYNEFFQAGEWAFERHATEEEKQKFFDTIKANGYKWNPETKTLEKLPKFKVGDRVRHKTTNKDDVYEISKVYDDSYGLVGFTFMLYMKYQDQYELAPNKIDISTLKPFESRVLVRDYDNQMWMPTFWGKRLEDDSNCSYLTTNGCYKYCIPYEGNEHLLGTTDDCDDFYKIWER